MPAIKPRANTPFLMVSNQLQEVRMNARQLMNRSIYRVLVVSTLCMLVTRSQGADPPPPAPGTIVWEHPMEQAASSIALDDAGRIYTTSGDRLLAFDQTGALLWEHQSDGGPFLLPPLILDGGQVLVAEDRSWTSTSKLLAVGTDGNVAWAAEEFLAERLPALLPGGDLVVNAWRLGGQHAVYRLDSEGRIVWNTERPDYPVGDVSVRGDGIAFVSGGWALRADGSTIWYLPAAVGRSSAAIGNDGTVYIGTEAQSHDSTDTGVLMALGTDGSVRWQYPSGSVAASPAILPDGSIVVGTLAGSLLRLDRAGALLWEQPVGAPMVSSPAITADGLIWCGAEDGRFYAFEAEDGSVRWEWDLGGAVQSSPAVGPDGRVYITAHGVGLFVIQGAAPPADSPWPMYRCNAARQGRNAATMIVPVAPVELRAEEGFERGAVTVRWGSAPWAESYEIWRGTDEEASGMTLLAGEVVGTTQFVDRTAQFQQVYFYRVRARNALDDSPFSEAIEGSQQIRRWTRTFDHGIHRAPALGNDGLLRVLLLVWDQGLRATNILAAVDSEGVVQWETELENTVAGPVLDSHGTAFLVTPTELLAVDATGALLWTTPLPPSSGQPYPAASALALTGDGELVVGIQPGRVHWFSSEGNLIRTANTLIQSDPVLVVTEDGGVFVWGKPHIATMFERNGLLRWNVTWSGVGTAAAGPGGTILGAGSGLLSSKSSSGTLNWSWRFGTDLARANPPIVGPDGTVYFVETGSRLFAVGSDGSPLWSIRDWNFTSSPTLLEDGSLLVYRRAVLTSYDASGTALWEARAAEGFPPLVQDPFSPIVAPDGTVFAVAGPNLVCLAETVPPASNGWPMARRDARQTGNASGPAPAPAMLVNPTSDETTTVNHVRLSWEPNPDRAWVEVWRADTEDMGSAIQIGLVEPGTFEYFDDGLPPGHVSYYWLRAHNEAGTTSFTDAIRAQVATGVWRLWEYDAASALSAPAMDSGGRIYVTTASGQLLAFEAGEPVWSFEELAPPLSAPVIALDGTVFVHNGSQLAAVASDGTIRWQRALAGGEATPAGVDWDGTLFLAQAGRLTAIGTDGVDRWDRALQSISATHLALGSDHRLRVTDGSTALVLDRNGTLERTIRSVAAGPIALGRDGTLYLGLYLQYLTAVQPDGVIRFRSGQLNSVVPPLDEPVLGPNGRAFISRSSIWNPNTHAVDAQGQVLWQYPPHGTGLVADAEGGLLFARLHHVTALRPDGTVRWDYRTPGALPAAPFLTENGLLCFSAGSRLVALQTDLRPAPSGWPMSRSDPQRSGRTAVEIRILGWRATEPGMWELVFAGRAGTIHRVEGSEDLEHWEVMAESVALSGPTSVVVPVTGQPSHRFIRVRRE
jgi:outer membrane protein assembly factor BamB